MSFEIMKPTNASQLVLSILVTLVALALPCLAITRAQRLVFEVSHLRRL